MREKKSIFILYILVFCLTSLIIRADDWLEMQVRLEIQEEARLRDSLKRLPPPPAPPKDVEKPVHVMFIFVDHWEPGYGADALRKAKIWYDDYGPMARKHVDADGCHPRHDWFCLYLEKEPLLVLSKAVYDGLGEMDIHIHHGTSNDNDRDNTMEMKNYVDQYRNYLNKLGACLTAEENPRVAFGFIHGMWALDNSRYYIDHYEYCGCNCEIDLLLSKGCYADFTFPAWGPMEPTLMTSKIFKTRDCNHPKSYNISTNIKELALGSPPLPDELVIFEGPWNSTNIDRNEMPTRNRMQSWVDYNVHVPEKPNWVFVKVYTHSAQNLDSPTGYSNLVGNTADQFYTDIENYFNDGINYMLHYCTAREAYNIAVAVADGVTTNGSPNEYRNYKIPPPVNMYYNLNTFSRLLHRDRTRNESEFMLVEALPPTLTIRTKDFTPTVQVYEKNEGEIIYSPSDAIISSTLTIPVLIEDPTPSRFYLLKENPINSEITNWDNY